MGLAPACADPPRCTACLLFIIRHEFSGLEFGGLNGWFIEIDLSGIELSGLDLSGLEVSGLEFIGVE